MKNLSITFVKYGTPVFNDFGEIISPGTKEFKVITIDSTQDLQNLGKSDYEAIRTGILEINQKKIYVSRQLVSNYELKLDMEVVLESVTSETEYQASDKKYMITQLKDYIGDYHDDYLIVYIKKVS